MKMKKITQFFRIFKKEDTPCPCSEKVAERVHSAPVIEEFERCVMCGTMTTIPISMPIDWRENYEIGCGQLCAACAKILRYETNQVNTLTTAQILLAVEQSKIENNSYGN